MKQKANSLETIKRGYPILLIAWMAMCPFWGQANIGIQGILEDDRLIFTIEEEMLDIPMLLVRNEMGHHQIKWIKGGNNIHLYISLIPSETGVLLPPIYKNQRIDNQLLGLFPIIKDRSTARTYSIDVTELFLSNEIRWNIETQETIARNLTYIKEIHQLEKEIIVRTYRTVLRQGDYMTFEADFSLYLLPEPMKPRLFDHRMGYGSEGPLSPPNWEMKSVKGSIVRWRMEKTINGVKLSPPIKPIIFYLDPRIPHKWRAYVKAGIKEWLPAFEEAGFSNAIEVREIPDGKNQVFNLSVEHSMIYWTENVIRGRDGGGSYCEVVTDFRSGEIIKADIYIGDPNTLAHNYFVRCAPLDNRANQFPFPDDLMGELIQSVTAHEAGHAFGLRDGNYGEYAYPFEKIRNVQWLKKMGHVPSAMSYSRHHHIAQPEDSIPPSLLLQRVGPMDHYQIKWGYMPILEVENFEAELPYLDRIIKEQDSVPWYRTTLGKFPPLGPGCTEEVADNNNPVQSMALGLKNLELVMGMISTVSENQRDDVLLETLHEKALEFWYKQMYHVLSMVGGYSVQYKNGSQRGLVFTPIPEKDQLLAVEFLMENAFKTPEWLTKPKYLARIDFSYNHDLLLSHKLRLLKDFLDPARLKRLEFMVDVHGFDDLAKNIVSKFKNGLLEEFDDKKINVSRSRQSLQIAFIIELKSAIEHKRKFNSVEGMAGFNRYVNNQYTLSILKSELDLIENKIVSILNDVENPISKAHLKICLDTLNWDNFN